MVFLLNIFDNGLDLGKCFFSNLKNNFPMLVFTLKEKGGLNHMIFLLLLLFSLFRVCSLLSLFLYFNSSLKQLRSASSYVVFAVSKISWLHRISIKSFNYSLWVFPLVNLQGRKNITVNFIKKSCGLNITVKTNLKTVDFLDVRFDLVNNKDQPYPKLNSETVYISKQSNHPPNILKDLPKAINKQITDTSCNQDIFDTAKTTYEEALQQSGFNEEWKCKNKDSEEQTWNEEKSKRRRKIIWFNPPISLSVKPRLGNCFLNS